MNKRLLLFVILTLFVICSGFSFEAPGMLKDDLNGSAINIAGVDIDIDTDSESGMFKVMGNIYVPEDEVVDGDVVSIMGNVKVDGKVNGDAVTIMGNLTANGPINGDAVSVIGNVNINNVVSGDTVSVVGNIKMGPNGKISGQTVEAVGGEIDILPFGGVFHWGFKIFHLILLFGLASLILALMPAQVKSMSESLGREPLRKALVGFIALILSPIIFLLVAISIIGLPLVPFLILALIAAIIIGYVPVAYFVGNRIKSTAGISINVFIELLIGIFVLWLIKMIPFVGFLTTLIIAIFALGLVLDTKFGTNRPWFKKSSPVNDPDNNSDDPGKE